MNSLKLYTCLASLLVLMCLAMAPAHAQATRTWVSGVGDDANPCSRTAPCKTFAGAISKTAAGGEISVLDPGGYGAVTVTKSISIVNDYSGEAGVLASGTNGIVINAAATDVIQLRGLIIDGAPPGTPGLNGVRFIAGGTLIIQKSVIKNFRSAVAGNGFGLTVTPSTGVAEVYVSDTVISEAGSGANGGAVFAKPSGSASVNMLLDRVQVLDSVMGIRLDGSTTSGSINLVFRDSTNAGHPNSGIDLIGGGPVRAMIANSSISHSSVGISAANASATVRLSGSIITATGTAVNGTAGAQLFTYQNNNIDGNDAAGTALTPLSLK